MLAFSFLVLAVVIAAETSAQLVPPPTTPNNAVLTTFQFCATYPTGDYCSPDSQRSFISCPAGIQRMCPQNQICAPKEGEFGSVECRDNLWSPISEKCFGKAESASYCYRNGILDCSTKQVFQCPADLGCKRRGMRAYCIEPRFIVTPEPTRFCEGTKKSALICHPFNLKKIINCSVGPFSIQEVSSNCGNGEICDVAPGAVSATCVPLTSDLSRFCSNKPLLSSYCVAGKKTELVVCSTNPQIMYCDGKCIQDHSISAKCIQP